MHKITSFLEPTTVWSEIPNEIKIVGETPVKKIMMIKDLKCVAHACSINSMPKNFLVDKGVKISF